MNVSAVIVTRGNVDLAPVLDSLPKKWERVVWDNGAGTCSVTKLKKRKAPEVPGLTMGWENLPDLSVYGRYAAIEYASHDLIFVQDDDVIVSDPQAIAKAWVLQCARLEEIGQYQGIVANMPLEFRHEGYTDSCLVGFGACFHRSLPDTAFARYGEFIAGGPLAESGSLRYAREAHEWSDVPNFLRTCDVVFATLTPRVLVDVPKVDREFASGDDRMWRQPEHYGERTRMLEIARKVRDE